MRPCRTFDPCRARPLGAIIGVCRPSEPLTVKSPLVAALLLALALPAGAALAAPPASAAAAPASLAAESPADAQFRAIYEKEWAWREAGGGEASEDGDGPANATRMPDVGAAAQQGRLKVWDDVLAQLDKVDTQALSAENRINYAIYRDQVFNLAADVRLRAYEMPFNADSSFWSNLSFMARREMKTAQDYRNYIARLNDVPRYFDQQTENMRAGLKRGFSVPRAVLDGREVSIATVSELKDPTQSPLYAPFKKLPARPSVAAWCRPSPSCAPSSSASMCRRRAPPWRPRRCPAARRITSSRSTNTPRWT